MPALLVRNLKSGPTVLTPDPASQEFIRWEGSGDPDGGDVQLVSDTAAKSVPFAQAVARQIIAILPGQNSPAMPKAVAAHLERRNAVAAAAAAHAAAQVDDLVVREADKDLLGTECVGPDSRGTGTCKVLVSVASVDRNVKPPLCDRHKDLAAQFVPEETVEGDKTVTRWARVSLGAREKAVVEL